MSDEDEPPPIPAGTPFYTTPSGYAALQAEMAALWYGERPKVTEIVSWAAGLGDRSENADYQYGKRRLREIDRRVRFLRQRINAAQVIDPTAQTRRDRVYFGATVTYARDDDSEATVMIVGSEEAVAGQGRISWLSPVARALLGKSVGDTVRVTLPGGGEALEIVAIDYR
ncbi:MAG: transcription elongation factor GreB [Rubritepida sp.]|nr:transcription elongation factor GreB [Rubritepida sp.]